MLVRFRLRHNNLENTWTAYIQTPSCKENPTEWKNIWDGPPRESRKMAKEDNRVYFQVLKAGM